MDTIYNELFLIINNDVYETLLNKNYIFQLLLRDKRSTYKYENKVR